MKTDVLTKPAISEVNELSSSLGELSLSGRREFLKSALALTVTLMTSSTWAEDLQAPQPQSKKRAHTIEVTDFSDYLPGAERPGTLRHALASAPRDSVITFSRPGSIELLRPLLIESDGITISGEKNPLVIIGDTVGIRASDVELQHLWIFAGDAPAGLKRPGVEGHSKGDQRDALALLGADANSGKPIHDISVRNCWIGFGIDECLSTYGSVKSVQIDHCIIGFGLNRSIHAKDKARVDVPGHGKGVLIGVGAEDISFTRNLLLHNFDRNIVVRGGTSNIRFNENTVYNWGRGNVFAAGDSGSGQARSSGTFKDNTYVAGKNSFADKTIFKPQNQETRALFQVSGNRGPVSPQQPLRATDDSGNAARATEEVLKLAGPHPGLKDRLSVLAVDQVTRRSGEVTDYLVTPQNPEAQVALGFYPTLENLVGSEQLTSYLKHRAPSR